MNSLIIVLGCFFLSPWVSATQMGEQKGLPLSGNIMAASVEKDRRDSKSDSIKAVEEYEKGKLARLKKNIGKRFLAVKTVNPPEFFESPDSITKKVAVREKEEFTILDVVQNQSGTMNFYKVRLEGGKIGYLSADAYNLEIRIKDKSIIPITKKVSKKPSTQEAKKKSPSPSKEQASKAIEMVKNHPIPSDPVSKDKRSIERRMREVKATSFPNLKWRYEAKEIGNNRYRITQYAEGESDRPITRTWVVDLISDKVSPENPAAKELYR